MRCLACSLKRLAPGRTAAANLDVDIPTVAVVELELGHDFPGFGCLLAVGQVASRFPQGMRLHRRGSDIYGPCCTMDDDAAAKPG